MTPGYPRQRPELPDPLADPEGWSRHVADAVLDAIGAPGAMFEEEITVVSANAGTDVLCRVIARLRHILQADDTFEERRDVAEKCRQLILAESEHLAERRDRGLIDGVPEDEDEEIGPASMAATFAFLDPVHEARRRTAWEEALAREPGLFEKPGEAG